MTEELETLFEGKEIHTFERDGEVWFPLSDLAAAWGVDRKTPVNLIGRNCELFEGMFLSDGDVTYHAVNERGLYLLMGKISADRLKNPGAKEAMIRFQRWVPELIQQYRKGNLKPPREIEAIVRSHLNIADAMVEYAHVDRGIMTTVALAKVENETGVDLSWLKGLVRKDRQQPPGYLNAGQVGEELGGLSAHSVNKILAQLGYQYWIGGRWQPTQIGMNYGENVPFTVINRNGSSHSDYQLRWSPEMVRKIRDHIDGTAQIQTRLGQ
jgi:prophage antirepressor-like protein